MDESGNLMYNGRKDEQAMVDNIMSSVRDRTPQNGMRNWFDKYGYDFENRGANDGGVPGQAAASDVEKLLAIGDNQTFPPGMSKTVGVSLEQCRDCRQFYWCLSQEVGADQYVAGPEEARIYFGTGEGAGDIGMVAYENGQRVMYRVPKALAQKLLWTPDSSFPWV